MHSFTPAPGGSVCRPHPIEGDPRVHTAVIDGFSGATLSYRTLVDQITRVAGALAAEGVGPGTVIGLLCPNTPEFTAVFHGILRAGATVRTINSLDTPGDIQSRTTAAATVFIAPPIAVAVAKHPLVESYDLSSVYTILLGAAPLDGALAAAVATRLNCRILQGYGMTEVSPVSLLIPIDALHLSRASVEVTVPNMDCKLVSTETGAEIEVPASGVSEPGELLVRGPNVMLGYLNNDRATRETIDADGFLHTGDIATVSALGEVTIVDRSKELIKYNGYQIAPSELEALLLTHPQIADAAVIGVADADGQEIPKAFVVIVADSAFTADEVMAFVTERVAPHKKVRAGEFIERIPKSASGKILRKDLRAQERAATV